MRFRLGKIILLNTPIGNLSDLTPRVLEALKEGVYFATEDTRVFRELLTHLSISASGKKILSLHDQTEKTSLHRLISLAEKEDLYVVSEAGSPIISDPAYPLVVLAHQKGIPVDSYSGISSPIMALELSGLPPIPFSFHGFLPREKTKRVKIFKEVGPGTHIFFEAPTRVLDTLDDLSQVWPQCEICLVRELSKKFQEVLKFKGSEWPNQKNKLMTKGEFVILFYQPEKSSSFPPEIIELSREIYESGDNPKRISKLISILLNLSVKEVYAELLKHKKR